MRKFVTLLLTAVMAFSMSAALRVDPGMRQLDTGVKASFNKELRSAEGMREIKSQSRATDGKMKAAQLKSLQKISELDGSPVMRAKNGNVFTIEGNYTLVLGDYYFTTSRNAEFSVSATITYSSQSQCYLLDCSEFPAAVGFDYSSVNKTMHFFQSYVGTFQGYYIVCVPFHWDYNQKSEVWDNSYDATFNESIGVFEFKADQGFAWPAFSNSSFTNWGGQYLDMYDVIRGTQAGGGEGLYDDNANWKDAGKAVFVDGWVLPVFGVSPIDDATYWYEVPLQQSTINAKLYRLVDPYHCNPMFEAGDNTSSNKGYIRFDVSDPDHVVFHTGVEAGWANPEAGVSMMFCFNQLGWYMGSFDVSAQTVISQLGNNIPYTTYKNGVVALDYITDMGERVYDATFGYQLNPLLGGLWPNENMTARIYMPGTPVIGIATSTLAVEATGNSATINFDYKAFNAPEGSSVRAILTDASGNKTTYNVTDGHGEITLTDLNTSTKYVYTLSLEMGTVSGLLTSIVAESNSATVEFTTDSQPDVVVPEELPDMPENADVIYADGKLAENLNVENWHNAVIDFNAANPTGADNKVFEFKAGNLTYDWGQAGYTDASMGLNMVKPANTGKFHDATLNFGWYATSAGAKYTVRLTSVTEENYDFTVTDEQVGKWNMTSLKVSEVFPKVAQEWNEDINFGEGYVFSIIVSNGTEKDVMYLNNIYYSDVDTEWTAPEHVVPAPETVPVPEQEADDVISVFSSKYEPATTFNIGWWGQSTVAELRSIVEENDVYYLRNFNYLGWELNSDLDVADYGYLHVDYWTADEGAGFGITPVTREGEAKEKVLGQEVKLNEWNSYDIALSEWADAGLDLATVFQIKFDKGENKNAYLANVYFWKEHTEEPVQPEEPDFDLSEIANFPNGWTFTLNGRYLGQYSLGEFTELFKVERDRYTVKFVSTGSQYNMVGKFTSPTEIEFTRAAVGDPATYTLTQEPYINDKDIDNIDDLPEVTVESFTAVYDAEAGTLTFPENSGLMYGYFSAEGVLSYWDDAFDFVTATKAWVGETGAALVNKNVYAYDIRIEPNNDERCTYVYYKLNGRASSVTIQPVVNGEEFGPTTFGTTDYDNRVKVAHPEEAKGELTFIITAVPAVTVEQPTVIKDENTTDGYHSFWSPTTVTVNNCPESDSFGRVLTVENRYFYNDKGVDRCGEDVAGTPYIANMYNGGVGAGAYAFDPQMTPIKNEDGKHGFEFGLGNNNSTKTQVYGDYQDLLYTTDGRLMLATGALDKNGIYLLDADDLNATGTPLFDKAENHNIWAFDLYTYADGTEKVLAIESNDEHAGQSNGVTTGRVMLYDLEDGALVNGTRLLEGYQFVNALGMKVRFDADGMGFYVSQHRSDVNEAQPRLIHANLKGEYVDNDYETVINAGGMAYNRDYTLFARAEGNATVALYRVQTGTVPGTLPAMERLTTFNATIGNPIMAIAFDYANNLYATGNSGEKLISFQLPASIAGDSTSVPSPSKYAFSINTTAVGNVAVDAAENADAVYYNLNGIRVNGNRMVPGVYIKVVGKTATKVVVR